MRVSWHCQTGPIPLKLPQSNPKPYFMEQIKMARIKETLTTLTTPGTGFSQQPDFIFSLSARRLAFVSVWGTGILLLLHIAAHFIYFRMPDRGFALNLVKRFGLNRDGNVPTLYSAFLLFAAAAFLYLVYKGAKAKGEKNAFSHWLVLCFLFIFLGLDEATQIHEFTSGIVKKIADRPLPGFLRHAWIIPYLLLIGAVGLHYLRFVLKLPARTRNQFIVAGLVYVGSAMGLEMLEGMYEARGGHALLVLQLQTIEETFEMLAVILFNYALMQYLGPKKIEYKLAS
jgi:hypothetical protein